MLPTRNLDYFLPPDLIATVAVEPRDSARLLVVDRAGSGADDRADPSGGGIVAETTVADLASFIEPGSVIAFNTTRVLPARIVGTREGTGGRMEALFLAEADGAADASDSFTRSANPIGDRPASRYWRCLVRGKHPRVGVVLVPTPRDGAFSDVRLVLHERRDDEPGAWIVRVESARPRGTVELLHEIGRTPIPPYIIKSRADLGVSVRDEDDEARYQTVFAENETPPDDRRGFGSNERSSDSPGPRSPRDGAEASGVIGSVAAPTAGLHFTPDLLARLAARGVERVDVTLHVGTGTFRPIEAEFVEDHPMHAEWCSMSADAVRVIQRAAREGRPVIAVGTTAARTLESYALELERFAAPDGSGRPSRGDCDEMLPKFLSTRLLITPGYRWRWCDGLFTNFHLPRSTLMAMVASRLDPGFGAPPPDSHSGSGRFAGLERLLAIYRHAIERRLRFYSFGDAMLIRPAPAG